MRKSSLERETAETHVFVAIDLDGEGVYEIDTGIGFLDHMLEQLARHGLFDLQVRAKGDLDVDMHHTVEDVGIVIGQAMRQALGDKRGIRRYADVALPMDETLTRLALDISDRPYLVWRVAFAVQKIGDMDTQLFREWFQAFVSHARITLHVENTRGGNAHHVAESCFKALARALRSAVEIDTRIEGSIPSTKGAL